MAKLYEVYGIPENPYPKFDLIPESVSVLVDYDEKTSTESSHKLCYHSIRLWGQATYWTALEAALLLAGIDPNDGELYGVCIEKIGDNQNYYIYKYSYEFIHARDYLFLFERSELAPKSRPIEWIKYFNLTIREALIKHAFEPAYCDEWQDFFKHELNSNNKQKVLNIDKPLLNKERDTMVKIIHALAKNGYKYPSHGSLKEMIDDFERNDNGVSEKTLKKYLDDFNSL